MYCKYCGKFIDDDSTFCQHCGRSLARNVVDEAQDRDHEPELTSSVFDYVEESTPYCLEDKPRSKKTEIILLVTLIILIAALAVVIFFLLRPASDSDDPYQDLSDADDPSAPNVPTQPDSSGSTNTPSIITNQMGNTPENYVTGNFRTVSYGNTVYHSYNSDMQFMAYDTVTGTSTPLGFYGISPNIYNEKLYYISADQTKLCSYDLSSGTITEDIFPKHISSQSHATSSTIYGLIVTDYGFLIQKNFNFFLIDHSGNLVKDISTSLSNSGTMVSEKVYMYLDVKELCFFDLNTLEVTKKTPSYSIRSIEGFSNGIIYTSSQKGIVKYDINNDKQEIIKLPDTAVSFVSCDADCLYISTAQGFSKCHTDGSNLNVLSSEYCGIEQITYSDTHIFGVLRKTPALTLDDIKSRTVYYFSINKDGSDFVIYDSKKLGYTP